MQTITLNIRINLHDDIYKLYAETEPYEYIQETIENDLNYPSHDEYSDIEMWIVANHRKYID